NLKRQAHICRARNSRQVTLGLGIAGGFVQFMRDGTRKPLLEVFFFLRGRPRLVWNLSTFDHAKPGRRGSDRAQQRRKRRWTRSVRLDIEVRAVEGLPDPIQVRLLRSDQPRRFVAWLQLTL